MGVGIWTCSLFLFISADHAYLRGSQKSACLLKPPNLYRILVLVLPDDLAAEVDVA